MPFIFNQGWDTAANNNGATAAQITQICASANTYGRGDAGVRAALTAASNQVAVVKGIHQDTALTMPHLTVDYVGARWHVDLLPTSAGGVAGYRVGSCSQ